MKNNYKKVTLKKKNEELNENFFHDIKKGIEKIIDHPNVYIDYYKKDLEKHKKIKNCNYEWIDDPDGFAKELDEISSDDNNFKKILSLIKKIYKDHNDDDRVYDYETDTKYFELFTISGSHVGKDNYLTKTIEKEFNIDYKKDRLKFLAILHIARTIARKYYDNQSSRHSSTGKRMMYSCIDAAMRLT